MPQVPLIRQILGHPGGKTAVVTAASGTSTTYSQLVQSSALLAEKLATTTSKHSRVAYLTPPSTAYASTELATFASGNAAVPLCTIHTPKELAYYLEDAQPEVIVTQTPEYRGRVEQALGEVNLSIPILDYDEATSGSISEDDAYGASLLATHDLQSGDPALFIYTSGTTGPPKGVVSSHRAFTAQITDLVSAWDWTPGDHILHFLPLHHIHGIQNKLNCALYAGASVEFMKFNPIDVWSRLADDSQTTPTLFMGVPTVYAKLLETSRGDSLPASTIDKAVANSQSMRLHVSGSAALPSTVMAAWQSLTGHRLLERYGMSEIGMALGNPLHGTRHEGHVGLPFDSVEVQICDPVSGEAVPKGEGSGELRVRGDVVFSEYWNKPEATAKEFVGGWFCTGDIAEYDAEKNAYKILGRASVDIIKSGGYKISALDIERDILEHDAVEEAVVVGVEDDIKGEAICVLLRLGGGLRSEAEAFGEGGLRGWMKDFTAPYKLPSKVMVMEDIPKNAMGKYAKKELKKLFQQDSEIAA